MTWAVETIAVAQLAAVVADLQHLVLTFRPADPAAAEAYMRELAATR